VTNKDRLDKCEEANGDALWRSQYKWLATSGRRGEFGSPAVGCLRLVDYDVTDLRVRRFHEPPVAAGLMQIKGSRV
jgi:hypothetical protein